MIAGASQYTTKRQINQYVRTEHSGVDGARHTPDYMNDESLHP